MSETIKGRYWPDDPIRKRLQQYTDRVSVMRFDHGRRVEVMVGDRKYDFSTTGNTADIIASIVRDIQTADD